MDHYKKLTLRQYFTCLMVHHMSNLPHNLYQDYLLFHVDPIKNCYSFTYSHDKECEVKTSIINPGLMSTKYKYLYCNIDTAFYLAIKQLHKDMEHYKHLGIVGYTAPNSPWKKLDTLKV